MKPWGLCYNFLMRILIPVYTKMINIGDDDDLVQPLASASPPVFD